MRSKKIIRLFTAMLAVVLCTTAFAVPASAGGGDGEPYYTETAGTEAAPTGDAGRDRGRSHGGCRVPGGHCDR